MTLADPSQSPQAVSGEYRADDLSDDGDALQSVDDGDGQADGIQVVQGKILLQLRWPGAVSDSSSRSVYSWRDIFMGLRR